MKHFKTPNGTELPLMDLKGKDYLQVAHRLVWFRQEKPLWAIETTILEGLVLATVKDESGRIISTAHKSIGSKQYAIESAETGAIGRALAMVGYGTAHCGDELLEGDELADAPTVRPPNLGNGSRLTHNAAETPTRPKFEGIGRPASANHASQKQVDYIKALYPKKGWTNKKMADYLGTINLPTLEAMNPMQADHLIKALTGMEG